MLRKTTDRNLESFRIFPYIAWGLILLFVFFVYKLTVNLTATAEELDQKSSELEKTANTRSKELRKADFGQ